MIPIGKDHHVTTVVIGAGHNGLAMSWCLTNRGIDHVVLERGEVANTWRRERWDSLRLLTPNWLSRLPGYAYAGDDPDGFMTMGETINFIAGYAERHHAPVQTHTCIETVEPNGDGYRVTTNRGVWQCRTLVVANGAFSIPKIPAINLAVPAHIDVITPKSYKRPDQLADGGVLVVGASASGIQLAKEIHASGRPVTLPGSELRKTRSVHQDAHAFGHVILRLLGGEGTGVKDQVTLDPSLVGLHANPQGSHWIQDLDRERANSRFTTIHWSPP